MTVYIKEAKAKNKTKNNVGKDMPFFENTSKNGLKYHRYKSRGCNDCKFKNTCTNLVSGRTLQRWNHEHILEVVHADIFNNNEIYKQRRCIVEHPFGIIKCSLGYNYFLRRQMENVDTEVASLFIAYNLKRLFTMFSTKKLLKMIQQ